jgi:Cu(I)/Ag(I) efflux system protein CusF
MKLAQMLAVLVLAGAAGAQVLAQSNRPADMPAAASATASGEVLAVYTQEKRLLLKHGPIENLGMGAMTMEFGVAQDKLLKALKKGDKVRFEAKKIGDDYVVTRIDVVK